MTPATRSEKPVSLSNVRRKTVINVLKTWRGLVGTARQALGSDVRPEVPKEDRMTLYEQMQACLEAKGGEVTHRAHTVELGQTYLGLNQRGRERFLRMLAEDFDIDREALDRKMRDALDATDPEARYLAEIGVQAAMVSPRKQILRQFNSLPNGFKFLVDLRADLLPLARKNPRLRGLEADLKNLLTHWFDVGLLDMRQINWDSSAALLEKLIAYEAVHEIRSWEDLKNRLDSDRRCFAFFHNKMPLEPLIFVEVALVKGLAGNVQHLLDESQPNILPEEADTAIFYSISNAQKGLAGISFGNFLIKRVVAELSQKHENIKTYATLSPIPGFRAWLEPKLKADGTVLLEPEEAQAVTALRRSDNPNKALLEILNLATWYKDEDMVKAVKPILLRLCANYLLNEKRTRHALDPVAHFHLTNGAVLERINWLGDTSPKGLQQSAGMMVNYHYKLPDIEDNHEAYAADGKITAARSVRALVK